MPQLRPEDIELFERLAGWIVERRLSTAAIVGLDGFRPLSYIGSQAMHALSPFSGLVVEPLKLFMRAPLKPTDFDQLAHLLEHRPNLERLVRIIEDQEQRFVTERRRSRTPAGD